MAIDSAEKRRAVAGMSVGWGVTPNSSEDSEWRQQVAWTYSGIGAASAGNAPFSVTVTKATFYSVSVETADFYSVSVVNAPFYTLETEVEN